MPLSLDVIPFIGRFWCERAHLGSPIGRGVQIQIQDDYSGTSLDTLARLGLEVYALIPNYRDCCPLCEATNCAVRHGLYHRRVADQDGSFYEEFPIPRFRCRGKGNRIPRAKTFSVLPAALVSRKLPSLPLMLWVLELLLEVGKPVDLVLEALAEKFKNSRRSWLPESPTIYRVLHLFAAAAPDWSSLIISRQEPASQTGELRRQAYRVYRLLTGSARASPVILTFNRLHFPRLFF